VGPAPSLRGLFAEPQGEEDVVGDVVLTTKLHPDALTTVPLIDAPPLLGLIDDNANQLKYLLSQFDWFFDTLTA
jgi:hypothetical protein